MADFRCGRFLALKGIFRLQYWIQSKSRFLLYRLAFTDITLSVPRKLSLSAHPFVLASIYPSAIVCRPHSKDPLKRTGIKLVSINPFAMHVSQRLLGHALPNVKIREDFKRDTCRAEFNDSLRTFLG